MERNFCDVRFAAEIALGRKMTDEEFCVAYERAEKKQQYIYERSQNRNVLDMFYLAQLVKEAILEFAFMRKCKAV